MFIGILYISLLFIITLFISKVLPIIIVKKIFDLELSIKGFVKVFFLVLFFPISIFFLKPFYLNLKKRGKIKGIKGFMKIFGSIIILSILFSLLINDGLIKTYIAKPLQINGQSMYPNFYDKEFILTENISNYNRFDNIIFRSNGRLNFTRIIGIPGDSLKIENGKVYLKESGNNEYLELNESYLNNENKGFTFVNNRKSLHVYILGEGQYFLMGDNRSYSTDSRYCFSSCAIEGSSSFIKEEDIVGKVYFDLGYFNFRSFEFIHPELGIDTTPKFFNILDDK